MQTFSSLLKDVENDVKIEAVKSLSRFVRIISVDKLHILIPLIIQLGKDPYPNVRCKELFLFSANYERAWEYCRAGAEGYGLSETAAVDW